ncbi:MAG: hypothetical protein CML20_22590 [Rheinheimera sp.]|nr:hypothetical protein [Rheinheimera sp.]
MAIVKWLSIYPTALVYGFLITDYNHFMYLIMLINGQFYGNNHGYIIFVVVDGWQRKRPRMR